MQFLVLGPLEVRQRGRPLPLGSPQQRELLAQLLRDPNRTVPRGRLIDALWEGEPPARAEHTLEVYVSRLRQALGRDRIGTDDLGYALRVERGELDTERFERLVSDARRVMSAGRAEDASDLFREALSLRRGPMAAEHADAFVTAHEDCIDAELRIGRHREAVAELEALVAEHPYRERLRGQLMLALYRCGRQAEALQQCRDIRRLLDDELGIQPGPELRRLEQSILRQEPSLAPFGDRRDDALQLASAARRAFDRSDPPAADALLRQALALLDPDDPLRLDLMPDIAVAVDDLREAKRLLDETLDEARATGDARIEANVVVRALWVEAVHLNPRGITHAEAKRRLGGPIATLEHAQDERGLASAWNLLADLAGTSAEREQAAAKAFAHARAAGARREEGRAMIALSGALLFGPVPADEAVGRFDELLARSRGTASYQRVLRRYAKVLAMRERFAEARAALAEAREVIHDMGLQGMAERFVEGDAAIVELDAEAPEAAERLLRPAIDAAPRAHTWQRAALYLSLAQALYDQRRFDESRDALHAGGSAEDAHMPYWHVWWLALEAQLLAAAGKKAAARRRAEDAVRTARRSDDPTAHGVALLALATAGDATAAQRAARRFRAKKHVPGLRRAEALRRG